MTNTVATIHENNEKNTAHAAVMEVLVNLKKTVVSISLDSPEQIVSLYQVALTCKDKLIELYFHYSDELQYDLSVNVDKKDDDDIRKVGLYATIMNLLEQQLFDYTNHYGRIQVVENEEIDSPSQIFVTVLHDETSLSDILPVVRGDDSEQIQKNIRKLFNGYKSAILWAISDLQGNKEVLSYQLSTTENLSQTFRLLSFEINGNNSSPEMTEGYETIESIFPHLYVRNPDYQNNIYLGYDIAQKRIQTLQEKNAIKEAIEKGDESQRLQQPENGQASTLPVHSAALKVLTREELPQKELIYQRVLKMRQRRYAKNEETFEADTADKTVAEKRDREELLRWVAYAEEKLQKLPEGIPASELDNAISALLFPLYKRKQNIQRRTPFYLSPSLKKSDAREYSDKLIRKYRDIAAIPDDKRVHKREKSTMYGRKYDSIESFFDAERKKKRAELEAKGKKLFSIDEEGLHKRMQRAHTEAMFSDKDRLTAMVHYFWINYSWIDMKDIQDFIEEYLESRKLLATTKKDLIADVDKLDRPQKLRETQQEVQAERNDKFVHDEKTIQRIYYAVLHEVIDNACIVRHDKEHKERTFASLDILHEVFTDLLTEDKINIKCLHKAYQQVYMHYRATGIDAYGVQDMLAHIKKNLSPKLRIDIADMTKVLQHNYDEYARNKIYIPGQEYRDTHYQQLANIFGVKLIMRKRKMMEDLLIEQTHTPHKMKRIDYIGDDYAHRSGMSEWTIHDTQKYLQEVGSLLLPEDARAADIREINDIPPEQWVNLDTVIPISDTLPRLRFRCHGAWKKDGLMEGNYVLGYNAQSGMLELIYDSLLRMHHDIMEQYSLHPSSILGGGYATINKGIQEILLESYMPLFLHEPRIVSVVAFKNAFKNILPQAKIVIGEDGMQNVEHHFDEEYGKKKEEQPENSDDLPF